VTPLSFKPRICITWF